nr:TonB-dependent receptor [Spirochaetota bacterium]
MTSTLSMRGMTSGQVLILLDGVPVNSKQNGGFDLSTINVANIEKIEVIQGGSDTKYNYSGAMGGIINIVTIKNKFQKKLSFWSSVSNLFYYPDFYYAGAGRTDKKFFEARDFFDTQKICGGFEYSNEKISFNMYNEGNIANNSYIYRDSNNIARKITGNEAWDLNGKLSLNVNLPYYMKLIFNVNNYYADKNVYGSVKSLSQGKQKDNVTDATILFDADMVGTDRVDTENSISYKFNRMEWRDISSESAHNLHSIFFVSRWNVAATQWLNIRFGGDFDYSYLDSNNVGHINYFNGGGYATFEFNIKNKVLIIPSIKLNYFKEYPVPIPKIGFVFNINEFITIKNNFFRTFKNPCLNDLYWAEDSFAKGNPDLKPETAVGGDFILEVNKPGVLNASGSFYVNYLFDGILWANVANKWSPTNIGEALYIGTDHKITTDFSKYIEIFGLYSFVWTLITRSENVSYKDNARVPNIPAHTFSLGITANWQSGNITVTGHFESERFMTATNIESIPGFFKLDLSFNQTFAKYFTIYANLTNAFNNIYEVQYGYPMPTGALLIGLKINYQTNFLKGDKNEKDR